MTYPTNPPPAPVYMTQPQVPMAPPPPASRAQRNFRTAGVIAVCVAFALIAYATMPSALASGIRTAFPTVKAVISGASDGQTFAVNQSITFSGANSVGNGLKYHWTFDDGSTADGVTVTKSFSDYSSGLNVSLAVSDPLADSSSGHSDETSISIKINPPLPTANFTSSVVDSFSDGSADMNFDGSTSTGTELSYHWDFGDGYSGYGETSTNYYLSSGTYTVTLTVTDVVGQTATSSQTITVP